MKIIIVGAGLSGLATYLHLKKHLPNPPAPAPPHTIHIYESHRPCSRTNNNNNNDDKDNDTAATPAPTATPTSTSFEALSASTAIVGGGLGVSPNGMRVLRDLDPALHAAVAAQGFRCENFLFMGQNGWTLGMSGSTSDRGEVCVSSTRHGLWACLLRADVEGEGGMVRYRRVLSVRRNHGVARARREGGAVVVGFEDGGEEECDLVIGADGVKSVVRKALFGEVEGEERFAPVYTGISGVGGVMKAPLPQRVVDNKALVFTFGRNGSFGYAGGAPASDNSLMWWSTFETDSLPSRTNLDIDEIKAEMRERYSDWADPVVRDIVSKADIDSIYPTWVLPDLPHWGEHGIVLIGDAAHALSPTTGQGASQALEDAQTLSLLLAETLKKAYVATGPVNACSHNTSLIDGERDAVAQTLKLFYSIRQPRVAEIAARGRKLDGGKRKMSIVEEYAMYCFLWVMINFPSIAKLTIGDVNAKLYGWSATEEIKKAMENLTERSSLSERSSGMRL